MRRAPWGSALVALPRAAAARAAHPAGRRAGGATRSVAAAQDFAGHR